MNPTNPRKYSIGVAVVGCIFALANTPSGASINLFIYVIAILAFIFFVLNLINYAKKKEATFSLISAAICLLPILISILVSIPSPYL